ncbi:hypothetical protein F7734_44210 [Scytonema sp. UIC 10036]|uniref:hypothetical protein n=1 Tax=Scytonema sp. UIC 10036 TaxID=2304196 RepID=UPI0012DA2616|nr:hypothetical protein [Scytonema sp. UIC 10036]MUG98931.1 hypothetical protein [Scytonema sp. UIC 10036]
MMQKHIHLNHKQVVELKQYIRQKKLTEAIALLEVAAGCRVGAEEVTACLAKWQRLLEFEQGKLF